MEHLIRVQNEYDRQVLVWLRGRIGDAALMSAARRVAADGKKPYLSTICRLLNIRAPSRRSFAEEARKTKIVETSSGDFYGKGYQDVQHRVPKIDNTIAELGWKPEVSMEQALRRIFEAYRDKVIEARTLVDADN